MIEKIITCQQGALRGETVDGVNIFRGVPFAQPPVGELRWKGPQKVHPWKGIRPALTFSAMPVQPVRPGSSLEQHYMSEDCLYLNIWAPENADKCPVLVWFYGGALQGGMADDPVFDGSEYAKMGIVVVNVNYRVGIFGFMCHPDMEGEDENGYVGNFGHRDQVAALEWVRDNIAFFGGDPGRITISGQSAGSASCCTMMISPAAQGLVHGAICHSGDVFQPERDTPLEKAEEVGVKIMEMFDCKSLDELRRVPFTELYKDGDPSYRAGGPCAAVIDGRFIPFSQGDMLLKNNAAQIPVIIGTNLDEGSRWAAEAYVPAVNERLGLPNDLYSMEKGLNGYATELAKDYWYARHLVWAKIRSRDYGLPTWEYVFARRIGPMGAFHGMEQWYTFQTIDTAPSDLAYTEADHALSKLMSAYWANFIRTGDPNGEGLPKWESKNDAEGHMQFDVESSMHNETLRLTNEIVTPAVDKWMHGRM